MSRRDLGREVSRLRPVVICRIGRHRWSADQNAGAGIVRRVCSVCRSVTIDLTKTAGPPSRVPTAEGAGLVSKQ